MRRVALAAVVVVAAAAGYLLLRPGEAPSQVVPASSGDRVTLPSGLDAQVHETLVEPQVYSDEVWVIVRVVAPDLGADPDPALADIAWLCPLLGLPAADAETDRIVVQLMDRPIPRGEPAPDATQYLSSFLIEDGRCAPDTF